MIDYDKFQKSLKHLELQFQNFRTMDNSQNELTKEAIKESVIQRFETCWDCLWKVLRRYMETELGLPEVPNSPKPILRIAAQNNLFKNSCEQWIDYADARIGTSHDYSGEKAIVALNLMESFIGDSIDLYEKMTGADWV